MRLSLLAWLALAASLNAETAAPDFFQKGDTEMQLFRREPDKIFLTLTRRTGARPALVLAAGAELTLTGQQAANEQWQLAWQGNDALLTPVGGKPEPYRRESPEEHLALARARAQATDAELNRVYTEVKARLSPERAAALRDTQREWIRFAYADPARADDAEAWLAHGDRAAERILFLQQPTSEASALTAQLKAAEEVEEWPAVAEICRRLLVVAPHDSALWEKRARAFVSVEDWDRAAATVEEWARAVPKPPPVIEDLRGDVADGRDDSDGAIRAWTAYARAAPKEADVRDKLADALGDAGQWPAAAAVLEQRLKIKAEATPWLNLANAWAMQHDWKKTAAAMRKVTESDLTDDNTKELLPRLERLQKAVPALTALDKIIAAARESIVPLVERAAIFLDAGWPELALPDADAALAVDGGSRAGALAKAAALVKLDRGEELEDSLINTSKDLLVHTGEWRELAALDDEIAHHGPATAPYAKRADLLNRCEQYALAEADAQAALKRDPQNAAALYARGLAFAEEKRTWEELADFRRLTELNPRDDRAWFVRGKIEAEHHRYALALEALGRTLALDPANEKARLLRARCLRSLDRPESSP